MATALTAERFVRVTLMGPNDPSPNRQVCATERRATGSSSGPEIVLDRHVVHKDDLDRLIPLLCKKYRVPAGSVIRADNLTDDSDSGDVA